MSANSNRKISRRPSVGKTLSRAAGLLTSVCLVAMMTVWATSSPFSPLSQQSDVETAHEPSLLLQKVKEAFALSESVLPSPSIKPVALQLPRPSPPALTETTTGVSEQIGFEQIDSDKLALAQLEKTHALQQEDRNAWLSFRRQKPLLVTKPIARAFELPLKRDMAMAATDLPEVHFASDNPRPLPTQIDHRELETVPQLPTQLGLAIDNGSDVIKEIKEEAEVQPTRIATEQPPARLAKLPVGDRYIAPLGNKNTTGAPAISPTLPPKKSWETGLY